MRILFVLFGVFFGLVSLSWADFNQGMSAYEQRDYANAYNEFKTLAEEGNADAQLMLGYMYAEGEGVLQNYVEAHKWFNLSAARGNIKAKKARDIIGEKMTAEQIATAQRLAREWQPTVSKKRMEEVTPNKAEVAPKPMDEPSPAEIKEIQKMLVDLGYDPGSPDGVIGGKTRSAIRSYQTDAGLMVDGEASKALLDHLKTAYEANLAKKPALTRTAASKNKEESREEIQVLVDSIRDVINKAEKRRATNRWILNKLRALVKQYDWPWRYTILEDTFADGDYTANPQWTVDAGKFLVDANMGLKSIMKNRIEKPEKPKSSREELGTAIFGAILKQVAPEASEDEESVEAESAEIHIVKVLPNTFALNITIISREDQGRLEFGPYEGLDRDTGYRLAYSPSAEGKVALLGLYQTGSSVIGTSNKPLNLADGRPHTLLWTRDTTGEMTVSVDENELFRVTDKRFPDAFNGFAIKNLGGEFGIRHIVISSKNATP